MKLAQYNPRRLAVIGLVLVVSSAFLGSRIEQAFSQDNNIQEQLLKYQEVMTLVQRYYVDKPNIGELNDAAIVGMESIEPQLAAQLGGFGVRRIPAFGLDGTHSCRRYSRVLLPAILHA